MLLNIVIDSNSISWLLTKIFKGLIIGTMGFIFFTFLFLSAQRIINGKEKLYHFMIKLFMLAGGVTLLFFVVDLCFGFDLINYLFE
ncbi:hypothetical protein [Staphylococcus haemolyticus]|uniref:hypothetical protein n=1 Tax=Staphylococcus haemolyticus TaxID=1283 RepID=UPI001F0A9D39|nr:hypothetical protein [Staphylococcus haemolyticus]MCH4519566.1 hypothetical protein [Staphylococcus haemolyticus]